MAVGTDPGVSTPPETDLTEAIQQFRQAHPEVAEAMRVFEMSDQAYETALEAMYGPRVSWTNAVNPPKP